MPRKDPGPSVKDKHLYESLREEANSKAKSARIANAAAGSSRSEVGRKGGRAGDYEDWSKEDLMHRAADLDIRGRCDMTKDELVDALRRH
ncbi:MAG TPA: Rho termination factor [Pedococcus sp.]|jgi:hypothetical protein